MKYFFLLFLGAAPFYSVAQSVSPEILSTTGEHFSTASVQISWTLGEVAIETIGNASNTVTQGFHQTNLTLSAIEQPGAGEIGVSAFPNPGNGTFTLEFSFVNGEQITLELYDLQGKLISTAAFSVTTTLFRHDFSFLQSGVYLLVIRDENMNSKTIQLIKQ